MNNKSVSVWLFFLCLVIGKLSAKDIVINHPVYEFKNTGINNVSKIELRKNETRVYVHTTFIPHWWIKFGRNTCYLEDSGTGEKWAVADIEKGEFDKEIYMPASGDSTFVLIFPPLGKQVKKINLVDDNAVIYGISLNPKEKAKPAAKEIPTEITQWMQAELSKAKRQTPSGMSRDDFFCKDTARIVGYIRGYSPKSGIKTAIAYIGNGLTREDQTRVIEISEDGRFEGKLPLNHPIYDNFYMNNHPVQFYIEPGQTLGIVLDWDDYLQADRYRNIRYKFQKTTFAGSLARVNEELATVEQQLPEVNARFLYEKGLKLDVKEFLAFADSATAPRRNGLQTILKDESLHPTARTVLRATHELILPYWYFEYEMNKGRQPESALDTTGFYDFLKQMPLDDHTLLTSSDFWVFINRFEYCTPFFKASARSTGIKQPSKSLKDYLFDELGLKQTEEDHLFFKMMKELEGKPLEGDKLDEIRKRNEELGKRYPSQIKAYTEKYINPLETLSAANWMLQNWADKDSVYADVLGLLPGITYEIIKVRDLKFRFSLLNREEARQVVDVLTRDITHPFLKQEAERMLNQAFPIERVTAYELPTTEKGTEIFRKAIDQHKGKYIFVDFWATTCGPCVHGIKEMKETRAKYKDHPDVVFVFLTNEQESPLNAYNKFVGEQELEFTHRLPNNEYLYLRQLFAFNGIPRYVLVDKEGKIMNNNYGMSSFKQTVKELGISKD